MDATLKAVIGEQLVRLSGTVAVIRAALDADRAAEFDRADAASVVAVVSGGCWWPSGRCTRFGR